MSRWVGILSVVSLAAGVSAAPVAAAPGWTASRVVSIPHERAGEPAVAVSADGRMLAAWVAVRGEVEIGEGLGQGIFTGYGRIEARLGSSAHGWGRAQVLSTDGETPIAAVGANGTAAVAWCRQPKIYIRLLYVSMAAPGRPFGAPTRLRTSGRYPASCPEALEVQPDGRVVVIWSETLAYELTPIKSRIQFALLRARRGRPVIGTVSANVPGEVDVHEAETADGDVLVAFAVPTRLGETQGVAQLPTGARRFTPPQAIEAAGEAIIRSENVTAGPGGAALVFAVRGEPATGEADEDAMAEQLPNGAFGSPAVIFRQPVLRSGDQFRPEGANVAFPAGGARVATWLNAFIGPPPAGPVGLEGEMIGPEVVMAAVRTAGANAFQAPVQLSIGTGGRARYERRPEYQRGLRNYGSGLRNGFRPRKLRTAEGELEVEIPQIREAAETFASKLFPRGTKLVRTEPLKALVIGAFVRGLSMRDVESLCEKAGLGKLSKSTASRVCEELRERYAAFKRRDLYAIKLVALFLDATYISVRQSGPKEGVLVAWGFTEDGERILLSVTLGMRESHEDWQELGRDLIARGLGAPMLIVAGPRFDQGDRAVLAGV